MIVMLVEMESVLMVVIAYIIGLLSVTLFNKYRVSTSRMIAEYETRFKEYEDVLVDMRIKLDMLEMRASDTSPVSQETCDASDANDGAKTIRRNLEQEGKGLVDYVLKLLSESPKTSRQIETIIGRSREHTARLMKKLFELGYVTRDTRTKPYTYAITISGKSVLSQVAGPTSV